jgi:hypothetical protein
LRSQAPKFVANEIKHLSFFTTKFVGTGWASRTYRQLKRHLRNFSAWHNVCIVSLPFEQIAAHIAPTREEPMKNAMLTAVVAGFSILMVLYIVAYAGMLYGDFPNIFWILGAN